MSKGNYTDEDRARKGTPVFTGFMKYFPDAVRLVAQLSLHANEKHNPGEPLHWSKDQSSDHADCLMRHQLDIGKFDVGNDCDHAVSVAWRAMAQLQVLFENGELATKEEITDKDYRLNEDYYYDARVDRLVWLTNSLGGVSRDGT